MTRRSRDVVKISEKKLMPVISEYLGTMEKLGKIVWWSRINSGLIFIKESRKTRVIKMSRTGTPDFIGCLNGGRFFGIEVKGTGKNPTDAQQATINQIRIGGGISGVVRSLNDLEMILGK